ncbi:MAG TPA: hypothetical protein VGI16_10325 [Candidatus Acidoferrum sp.]
MTAETTRYLELLEQRIALMGSLAEELAASRVDVVGLDIAGLEARILKQEGLCVEIRALDTNIDQVQRQCNARLNLAAADSVTPAAKVANTRMRETLARLREAQAKVQLLNEAHRTLLQRSRRTVGALLNSYHSFALTYPDPSSRRTSSEERV